MSDKKTYSWSGDGMNTFTKLMTGAEWYDRFLDEVLTIPDEDLSTVTLGQAYRAAAKRAAGLEGEQQ